MQALEYRQLIPGQHPARESQGVVQPSLRLDVDADLSTAGQREQCDATGV